MPRSMTWYIPVALFSRFFLGMVEYGQVACKNKTLEGELQIKEQKMDQENRPPDSGKLEVNEGMLIENIVAQMLTASANKLFFYSKSSEEAENRMEIDFLLQKVKVTSRHNIRPIEVKSGKNYTLSSLKKCMNKYGEYMTTPTVLHAADYKVENGVTYLPLYMTPLL